MIAGRNTKFVTFYYVYISHASTISGYLRYPNDTSTPRLYPEHQLYHPITKPCDLINNRLFLLFPYQAQATPLPNRRTIH